MCMQISTNPSFSEMVLLFHAKTESISAVRLCRRASLTPLLSIYLYLIPFTLHSLDGEYLHDGPHPLFSPSPVSFSLSLVVCVMKMKSA